MPIFEFQCLECDDDFEKLVMGESFDYKCLSCGSENIQKKFSVFGMSGGDRPQASSGPDCGG